MWTTPKTWGAGDVMTPALINSQLRDNLLEVKARLDAFDDAVLMRAKLAAALSGFPAPVSVAAVAAGVAVALVASPNKITRRGFFAPWRRS